MSIRSFLANGHDYHLYTYGPVAGVPDGVTLRDAGSVLSRERVFTHTSGFGAGSYGAFSDWFRYQLVFANGGWWVDTDLVCLRHLEFTDDYVFATEHEDDMSVLSATCAFKSPAGAEYLKFCLEACESKKPEAIQWSEIGPYLLDDAIVRFGLKSHQVATATFNPVHFFDFRDLAADDFDLGRITGSHAVHLWSQMWASDGLTIDQCAHPRSLYRWLERRYPGPAIE